MQNNILIVGNEGLSRGTVRHHLETQGFQVAEARSGNIARQLLQRESFDLVIIDDRPSSSETAPVEEREQCEARGVPVLSWTRLQEDLPSLRPDDLNLQQLAVEVQRVLDLNRLQAEVDRYRRTQRERLRRHPIAGDSAATRNLNSLIQKVSEGPLTPILIDGERGTGKELVARHIHFGSSACDGPFVTVEMTDYDPALAESELFGSECSTYTDSSTTQRGIIEDADGGTLYIKNLELLTASAQNRLLHLIEDGSFSRVGGRKEQSPRIRVIASSQQPLHRFVDNGQLNSALYRSLNVLQIPLPALRERRSDVPILLEFFLEKLGNELGQRPDGFTNEARECLLRYDWPGNVREIRNVVERLVIVQPTGWVHVDQLPREIVSDGANTAEAGDFCPPLGSFTLEEIEVQTLQAALDKSGHNQVRAAQLLGVSRDTLRYRMKKFGLLTRRQRKTLTASN